MKCPCCPRGEVTEHRICDTCGVAIAIGSMPSPLTRFGSGWRTPRRRQDQDETRKYAEYAATKEDKS